MSVPRTHAARPLGVFFSHVRQSPTQNPCSRAQDIGAHPGCSPSTQPLTEKTPLFAGRSMQPRRVREGNHAVSPWDQRELRHVAPLFRSP